MNLHHRLPILLASFLALSAIGRADRPDTKTPSPDGKWLIETHWSDEHQGGYETDLRNVATGKVYFKDTARGGNLLPSEVTAMWTHDSHYVAINFYYGHRLWGINIFSVATKEPSEVQPANPADTTNLEMTLLRPGDTYVDGQALNSSTQWLNNTDLATEITMDGHIRDKAGTPSRLAGSWTQTLRCKGATYRTLNTTCESYDKSSSE